MKKKAEKPGRKPKGGRAYLIKLTDEVASHYRKLGGGNLTLGIERGATVGELRRSSGPARP